MKFSLLYTTARPHLINGVIDRWRDTATDSNNFELIIVTDDPFVNSPQPSINFIVNHGRRDCVTGWNLAAEHAVGDIFIQVSDDLFPPLGWDSLIMKQILQGINNRPDVVLNLLDERKATTAVFHPVLTRTAYEKLGYLYPPEFESMCCDVWFFAYHSKYSLYGVSNGRFWTHVHRSTHKVLVDGIMLRHESRERYERGKQIFQEYGKIQDLDFPCPNHSA